MPTTAASHQDPESVRALFSGIAGRYDLANHLLSGGMDFYWRRVTSAHLVSCLAGCGENAVALDLATGSGDLLRRLQHDLPQVRWIGADFCRPMLDEAHSKGLAPLVHADGMRLPFGQGSFHALTVAFGLRNMADYSSAITEFARVLKPGGSLAVLDFSMPEGILGSLYRSYLHRILPAVAGLVTGDRGAYQYLGESIEQFPRGSAMLDLLQTCGFESPQARPMTFGIVTLYTATRVASF